ncbi:methyl-accepting chemotaxis protein [Phaeobacter porticola]|uniref:Methyl-accepting chemotaxis protein n=1 Tax=Phaeobacter porticola TaxID=1844006 RepID=A0A1L3IA15_9RHOB|nr:methyl-accepting chemotaxis protein [Phaeobacter porticola]APG48926.1 methyl-accepting chemotaxis protein [Phaeobacter porticola]
MKTQTRRRATRRWNPLSSIRAKMFLILLAMAGTSAAIGFAVILAFERVSAEMHTLSEKKLPELELSGQMTAAASRTKDAMVAVMLADTPGALDFAESDVATAVAALDGAVSRLPETLRDEFKPDVIMVQEALDASIRARTIAFKNASEVIARTTQLQELSSALQATLAEMADEAYLNLTTGGEQTMSAVDATLVDLVEVKFATLQALLQARAEINLISGIALAIGETDDRAMQSILTDLAKASDGRLAEVINTLEVEAPGVVPIFAIRDAAATLQNAVSRGRLQSNAMRQDVLSARLSSDTELATAVDDMVFEVTLAAEDASTDSKNAIQGLLTNEVGFLNTLLEINTWISNFQVAALDVVTAQGVLQTRAAAEAMERAAAALADYKTFDNGRLAAQLENIISLAQPDQGLAIFRIASLTADADATKEANATANAVLQIASRASLLGSGSRGEIAYMASDIAAAVDAAHTNIERLLMVAGALLVAALLLTHWLVQRPLNAISRTTERLADGDLSPIKGFKRTSDEIHRIAQALTVFRDGLVEKETLSKAAEEERAAHQAEQTAAVTAIGNGLARLAQGDLSARINEELTEGYAQLQADFNLTVETLNSTVGDMVDVASSIRNGADEISQASDDLSRRTESQAATLEETAAALDELTASVKSAAEGARSVETTTQDAKTEAVKNSSVVSSAVSAMTEIEESSKHIAQIIGVIDDIAFQTNLLALNAGVEAARAGDAGRGFAVVASEVRGLSQRTSEAAMEIKTLISESSKKVDDGVELVGKAGAALGAIVEQVGQISQQVSGIADGAASQSTGLHEINIGMSQLDQVTQQNAAMVEESTAASHMLRGDAAKLAELVSNFTVATMGSAPPVETADAQDADMDDWEMSA